MKIHDILNETRSHSDQNPKISINQIIADRLAATSDTVAGMKNLFVSFTRIEKLGINPGSKFKGTPLGIYAYPADYVFRRAGLTKPLKSPTLPFAGEFPFVNLFNAQGLILNLGKFTNAQLEKLFPKFEQILIKVCKLKQSQAVHEVEELVSRSEFESESAEHAGSRLWHITRELAETFLATALGSTTEIAWNKLFRLLSISGVVDPGLGIIDLREKTQAVFFSIDSIANVSRAENKYSPDQIAHRAVPEN